MDYCTIKISAYIVQLGPLQRIAAIHNITKDFFYAIINVTLKGVIALMRLTLLFPSHVKLLYKANSFKDCKQRPLDLTVKPIFGLLNF